MLSIKNKKLDYGSILNSPEGFELERAVATSYSLHLTALLSLPVALFYNKKLDGKLSEDRIDIFDAIQKTSDAVTVYCQLGKITGPEKSNKLFSFLEDSIHEVLPAKHNYSFHPKIWVIRFKNKEKKILYRVIILSRNLSLDRSWDIAFYSEGFVGKKNIPNTAPIADYIKHLSQIKDFNNSKDFIQDLRKTEFVNTEPFGELNFHPMGFGKYKNPLAEQTWKDILIISPFLDITTLVHFSKMVSGKKYLLSREEELDKIEMDVLNMFDPFMFSQQIVEGESLEELEEGAEDETMYQNLHAKIFIGKDHDNKYKWYLGSANCTNPAMERNEEFLVSMTSSSNSVSVNKTLESLINFDEKRKIFEPYHRLGDETIKTTEFDFRVSTHALLTFLSVQENFKVTCIIEKEEKGLYSLQIQLAEMKFLNQELIFEFQPYGWKGDSQKLGKSEYLFSGIAVQNLSPFFVFKITNPESESIKKSKEFFVKIDFELPKNRKQEIFKSIIHDKERFMQLIQFILGGEESSDFFTTKSKRKKVNLLSDNSNFFYSENMYEELLISASRNKSRLIEIERLLSRIKEMEATDLIPPEFEEVWKIFSQFAKDE